MGSSSSYTEDDFSTSAFDPSTFSVQELVKLAAPDFSIPQPFVRINQQSPSLSVTAPLPPTIDMSRLLLEDDHHNLELHKLHSTCQDWGIFQLVNHGVSSSLLEKLKHEVEEFYRLPLEEKLKYKIREGELEGYGRRARGDGKYDWVDTFNIITNPLHRRSPHLFPQLPLSLRSTMECYLSALQKLATKLIGFMGKALKIKEKEMMELFDGGLQAVRMAYYPPCPQPESVMGLFPHSDMTLLTILHQLNGVDGLEVKKNGLWFPFNVNPDAFVVNVGDIFQIFSNGVYHSIEHKVTCNKDRERITVTFNLSPNFEAEVGPSLSLINAENPPLFRRVGMEEYFKQFFTLKIYGKNYLDYMRIQPSENGD
ncbi:hypothetical protein CXB51_034323 [Gossypium anomalum]|uniref:Fe2OG dioxygenase domain-containing protein n=1 Tax=Gossypium anomalum TaxID=47600 RepID=A0A8J5XMJ2_9ROSI|nr:hypothetical protein CXB51_034323 [Gossypium anomalum]